MLLAGSEDRTELVFDLDLIIVELLPQEDQPNLTDGYALQIMQIEDKGDPMERKEHTP
jgi:hypothetical protein